jgi:aspartate/methionine/tyrosine aminotransferase
MHALQIAVRMTAGSGDEVIVPTPAWPNFRGALEVAGATTREVPMRFGNAGWQLEIDDIARAITPRTRALCQAGRGTFSVGDPCRIESSVTGS